MSRCPFAEQLILPENAWQRPIVPTQVLFHSAVDFSASTLRHYFGRSDVKAESHFYGRFNGGLEQYMDTNVMAHANVAADVRAVSIETDDDGYPDRTPWSPAQINTLVRLGRWLLEEHPGIRPQVIPSPTQPGFGYHSMFKDPRTGLSPWSHARGKTCPGAARIAQFPLIVLAITGAGPEPLDLEEDEMWIARSTDPQGRQRNALVAGVFRTEFVNVAAMKEAADMGAKVRRVSWDFFDRQLVDARRALST